MDVEKKVHVHVKEKINGITNGNNNIQPLNGIKKVSCLIIYSEQKLWMYTLGRKWISFVRCQVPMFFRCQETPPVT